jgi:LysR family hydrogen peroxide-inducible transcriptional activator
MTNIQLEYVVAVDTCRHFAAAADTCFVTQPTLSMQIQKLEEELGVKIFDRSKQPVVPTETGVEIIRQARVVLKESLRIKEIIADKKNELSGEVRLGILPTLAPYLLPLFLDNFIKKYPSVKVKLTELTTSNIIAKLKSEELDVGILVTPLDEEGLFESPLFYEEFFVYVSKGSKLVKKQFVLAEDIDPKELLLLEEGHCMRSQIINLCELKYKNRENSNLEYEAGSIETLKKMVEMNHGVTILPELALNGLSPRQWKMVHYFKKPAPVRQVSLVMHRNYLKRRVIESLKDEILRVIPEKMKDKKKREIITIIDSK